MDFKNTGNIKNTLIWTKIKKIANSSKKFYKQSKKFVSFLTINYKSGECVNRACNYVYMIEYGPFYYEDMFKDKTLLATVLITQCNFGQVLGVAGRSSACSEMSMVVIKDTELLDVTFLHEVEHRIYQKKSKIRHF